MLEWVRQQTEGQLLYRAHFLTNSSTLAIDVLQTVYVHMKNALMFFASFEDIEKFLFEAVEEEAERLKGARNN